MALCNFGGRHTIAALLREHHENVLVERLVDTGADVLDVLQQEVQAERYVVRGTHHLRLRDGIHEHRAARNNRRLVVLQIRGDKHRRIGLVVDRLRLPKLFLLQLMQVAQGFHSGGRAVDVAARNAPTAAEARERPEARLTENLLIFRAVFEIHRAIRHILVVDLFGITHIARLDGVHHRHPFVVLTLVEHLLRRTRTTRVAKFLHKLRHRHAEFAVERVHSPAAVRGNGVLADRQRHAVNNVVGVVIEDHRRRAVRPQLLVGHGERLVDVAFSKHHLHEARHASEPILHLVALVELRVQGRQAEPGASGTCHPGHHAARQGAQSACPGVVQDSAVPLVTLVVVGNEEPPRTRCQHLGDFLPMRHPRSALRLQSFPALKAAALQIVRHTSLPPSFSSWSSAVS